MPEVVVVYQLYVLISMEEGCERCVISHCSSLQVGRGRVMGQLQTHKVNVFEIHYALQWLWKAVISKA